MGIADSLRVVDVIVCVDHVIFGPLDFVGSN
jgi:hypothetical protein